jgi:DNA-binding XRE family transcriptional regulator
MRNDEPTAAADPILVTQEGYEMVPDLAKTMDQVVARRIREQRMRRGMTQQRLAALIGVAFQQAHKYERGLSRVSAGRLFHIATVLEMPIAYFFGEDPPPVASWVTEIPAKVPHDD